jgi:hypothetical protein
MVATGRTRGLSAAVRALQLQLPPPERTPIAAGEAQHVDLVVAGLGITFSALLVRQFRPQRDDDAFGVVADEQFRRGERPGQQMRDERAHRR